MSQQTINVGAAANDGTGELGPRGWLQKVNANFNEAYAVGTVLAPLPGLGWFNVKAYGAKGDDTTDDTAAINLALTAALTLPGGTVYFPAGKYKITSTLTVLANTNNGSVNFALVGSPAPAEFVLGQVNGEGQGWGAQLKYYGTSGDAMFLQYAGSGNGVLRAIIRDLTIVGNGINGTNVGASSGSVLHCQSQSINNRVETHMTHVRVIGGKDHGYWMEGNAKCLWYDCHAWTNSGKGFYHTSYTGNIGALSRESTLYGLQCYLNTGNGFELAPTSTAGGGASFFGLVCSNNTGQGVVIGSQAGLSSFYSVQCEANGTSPIIDIARQGQQFFGIQINYSSAAHVGLRVNGVFQTLIHGLTTNSAGAQIDVQFAAGNSHSNLVELTGTGDGLFSSHVSDLSGNTGNWVTIGGRLIAGDVANGVGVAALGSTSPAITPGTVYRWLRMYISDGSVVYIPCWK